MDALNGILGRFPIILLAFLACSWMGYDFYDWLNSSRSTLGARKASYVAARKKLEEQKKKLGEAEEFLKGLDLLRTRIRQLAAELESTRAILSADVDLANFVRMVTLEAKKLGLNIRGIRPAAERKFDNYTEMPFSVSWRGAYVQALVFFDRVAKLQQVVRIADFDMKPTGTVATKYVELEGSAKLITYKYIGNAVDEIGKKTDLAPGGKK